MVKKPQRLRAKRGGNSFYARLLFSIDRRTVAWPFNPAWVFSPGPLPTQPTLPHGQMAPFGNNELVVGDIVCYNTSMFDLCGNRDQMSVVRPRNQQLLLGVSQNRYGAKYTALFSLGSPEFSLEVRKRRQELHVVVRFLAQNHLLLIVSDTRVKGLVGSTFVFSSDWMKLAARYGFPKFVRMFKFPKFM